MAETVMFLYVKPIERLTGKHTAFLKSIELK